MYTGLIALNLYSSYLCQEITSVGSGSESNNKVHQMKQSNRRKTNCNKQLLQTISIEKKTFWKKRRHEGFFTNFTYLRFRTGEAKIHK